MEERPLLFSFLVEYWEAYQRLSSCRMLGFSSPGPIPWTAIDAYGKRYGYYGVDFEKLSHFVTVLDGVYLSYQAEKGKTGPKSGRRGLLK